VVDSSSCWIMESVRLSVNLSIHEINSLSLNNEWAAGCGEGCDLTFWTLAANICHLGEQAKQSKTPKLTQFFVTQRNSIHSDETK